MANENRNLCLHANAAYSGTSIPTDGRRTFSSASRAFALLCACAFVAMLALAGCGSDSPKPDAQTESKPAEPAIPADIQAAAQKLLGNETKVLLIGDLAKTGKQQFLAANVVPNTPKSTVAGLVITRAVIAQNDDGTWNEVFLCDEYLKNPKGFLGLTPLAPVPGWKLQFEQSAEKGLQLYFTQLQTSSDSHVLPIGVRWNPATKRYQSLDRNYEHFLLEAPTLENTRSVLR
jgi:hypothetical protein